MRVWKRFNHRKLGWHSNRYRLSTVCSVGAKLCFWLGTRLEKWPQAVSELCWLCLCELCLFPKLQPVRAAFGKDVTLAELCWRKKCKPNTFLSLPEAFNAEDAGDAFQWSCFAPGEQPCCLLASLFRSCQVGRRLREVKQQHVWLELMAEILLRPIYWGCTLGLWAERCVGTGMAACIHPCHVWSLGMSAPSQHTASKAFSSGPVTVCLYRGLDAWDGLPPASLLLQSALNGQRAQVF